MEADSRASVLDREGGEDAAISGHSTRRCREDAEPKAFDHDLATPGINEIDSDRGKE
jgi:hypothetical protein